MAGAGIGEEVPCEPVAPGIDSEAPSTPPPPPHVDPEDWQAAATPRVRHDDQEAPCTPPPAPPPPWPPQTPPEQYDNEDVVEPQPGVVDWTTTLGIVDLLHIFHNAVASLGNALQWQSEYCRLLGAVCNLLRHFWSRQRMLETFLLQTMHRRYAVSSKALLPRSMRVVGAQ